MSVEREEHNEVLLKSGDFLAVVRDGGDVFLNAGVGSLYYSAENKEHTVELLEAVLEELL
jgi:hypothetical protein